MSVEAVRSRAITRLAELARVDPAEIDPQERFGRYGLDSLDLNRLAVLLSEDLGRQVPPALMFRYPTPDALARHLAGLGDEPERHSAAARETPDAGADEPIAVIGLACRFPGAPDPVAFWRLLCLGDEALREVPPDRWDAGAFHSPNPADAGKAVTKRAGFLDRVDEFDSGFFEISAREAAHVDPQQRLMLELAWEALEDAAIPPRSLAGSVTGVYAGAMWTDYGHGGRADLGLVGQHTLAGRDLSILPARVSYALGLEGPSMVVNTACSSSLVAVHLAAQALRAGECELALAGGVSLMLSPETMVALSKLGALSPDGHSWAFDERANGYGRGEGGGAVALKPLRLALAAGNPVYCVIRGSALNNDGFSNSLTAPNGRAQEAVLRRAYARAGVDPAEVQYVEAHGTGTRLGDPIEAAALAAALCSDRPTDRPLRIGSVKANIGHLEPAAGIAGLIKAALSMRHGSLPPAAGFDRPNAQIPFEEWGLAVQASLEDWPVDDRGHPLAGVSAFGFGGTNCHLVLEGPGPPARVLALAADEAGELTALAESVATLSGGDRAALPLVELCAWAASRTDGRHRLAAPARTYDELTGALDGALAGRSIAGVKRGEVDGTRPRVAFLFGGQGSQWAGMAVDLIAEEPVFRDAIRRCDAGIRRHREWSLLGLLTSRDAGWLADTTRAQPAIFAIQVALAELWRAWGVEPDAVLGASMGEVAAAHVAGALQLSDAIAIMCRRSEIASELSGQGAMAAVELSPVDAERAIEPFADRLWVAGVVGPESTIVTGDSRALTDLLSKLDSGGVPTGRIEVDYASHCPYVDGILERLQHEVELPSSPLRVPFYSAATGGPMRGSDVDAAHWIRTERDRWDLDAALERLLDDGCDVLVELDPHPVLARGLGRRLRLDEPNPATALVGSLRRGEPGSSTLAEALAALHVRGASVRWDRVYPCDEPAVVPAALSAAAPGGDGEATASDASKRDELLVVSGRSPEALADAAEAMADWLLDSGDRLSDICSTAALGRSHHEHRLAVVGPSRDALATSLRTAAAGHGSSAAARGEVRGPSPPEPVFVLSGQGSQWPGMARELLTDEPAFRDAILACDAEFEPLAGWSLLAELEAPAEASQLARTHVAQPLLFAVQVALAQLWASWGVRPAAVIGHSVGEVTAAHLAGTLNLADALRVVHERGQAMERQAARGAMAVVELATEGELVGGREDHVAIAAINDPESTVLSGESAALAEVVGRLRERGVNCRDLAVEYAFHSPLMAPAAEIVAGALGELELGDAEVPMYSTVTGGLVDATRLDAEHWARNVRERVRFAEAVDAAAAAGHRSYLEVGAHPVLLGNVRRCLDARGVRGSTIASLRRDEPARRCLISSLGALWARHELDLSAVFGGGSRRVALPTYPWQRERHWLERAPTAPVATTPGARQAHSLLGSAVSAAVHPGTHLWQPDASAIAGTGLADLRVHGERVLTAAALVQMMLVAGAHAAGARVAGGEPADSGLELADLTFERMVPIEDGTDMELQVAATTPAPGEVAVEIFTGDGGEWSRHAVGTVRAASAAVMAPAAQLPGRVQHRCSSWWGGAEHYRKLEDAGVEVEPALRSLEELWLGDGEALGRVAVPESCARGHDYGVHPALLDGAIQLAAASAATAAPGDAGHVVTDLARLRVHRRCGDRAWAHASLRSTSTDGGGPVTDGDGPVLDLRLTDEAGEAVAEFDGVRLRPLAGARPDVTGADHPLAVEWRRAELDRELPEPPPGRWLLLADRGGTGVALADELHARGQGCVTVPPDDLRSTDDGWLDAALAEVGAGRAPSGVLDLRALDGGPSTHATGASAVALVQALMRRGWRDAPRLWLFTRAAQPPGSTGGSRAALEASLWGLSHTIALEHPELACTAIDLAADPPPDAARQIALEVLRGSDERDVALRIEGRFVARLVPAGRTAADGEVELRADGTYLVAVGRAPTAAAAIGWLASGGARHIAVVGRDAAKLAASRPTTGSEVASRPADPSDADALSRVVGELERTMPPLRGIVHEPNPCEERTVLDQDPASLHETVARATAAASNLQALAEDRDLDFLVLHSSADSVLGAPARGAHAATGAFLDALAHHGNRGDQRTLSVNWGTIGPDERAQAAGRLLADGAGQLAVLGHDARQWIDLHPSAAANPMLVELHREPGAAAADAARLRAELAQAGVEERTTMLERHVREQLAETLGEDSARVHPMTPFRNLGLESLMAVELRNRLEASLGLKLRVAVMFTYSTVCALAGHLLAELGLTDAAAPPTARQESSDAPRAREHDPELSDLSDAEAKELLLSSMRAAEEQMTGG